MDDSLDWCIMSNASLGFQVKESTTGTLQKGKSAELFFVMVLMTSDEGALDLRVGAREL